MDIVMGQKQGYFPGLGIFFQKPPSCRLVTRVRLNAGGFPLGNFQPVD
jgi:hypothetical protein